MTRPPFEKVAIVGVGLIGGSLGLAVRKRKLAKFVMGVVRRRSAVAETLRKKTAQGVTLDLKEGVRGADLVLLCSPVSAILGQMRRLKPMLAPGALVLDVASTKALVHLAAKKHLQGVRFVGCHPMAGSSRKGAKFAEADLFEDSVCYLTSRDAQAEKFWRALGAKVSYLTPEKHDEWVARTSHLPHILAFTLFRCGRMKELQKLGLEAVNPSIRDLARLSKSDPKLWADILLSNRREILGALKEFEPNIARLRKALSAGDTLTIQKFIAQANSVSQKLAPKIA